MTPTIDQSVDPADPATQLPGKPHRQDNVDIIIRDLQARLARLENFIGQAPTSGVGLIHSGDAAGGDLAGAYPNPSLANNSTSRGHLGLGSAAILNIGDYALQYYGGGGVSYGPGLGNPFTSTGVTLSIDPYARLSGANYVCRNTGYYKVGIQMGYLSSANVTVACGVKNTTSGWTLGAASWLNSGLITAGVAFTNFISCNAGDVLTPFMYANQNISLIGSHPNATTIGISSWFAGQLM